MTRTYYAFPTPQEATLYVRHAEGGGVDEFQRLVVGYFLDDNGPSYVLAAGRVEGTDQCTVEIKPLS